MKISIARICAAFVVCLSVSATAAPAGKVLALAGNASIEREGKQLPIEAGTLVETGDVLAVAERSALQVRFTDESVVALRASTQFKIEDYRFEGDAQEDRSIFGLLKGGMRTITGLIGKANQKSYEVRTTTATVGIRGTHFTLVSCDNDCFKPDGSTEANGTFGGVSDGTIVVTNAAGEQEFNQQDYFHVASISAAPERLLTPPALLEDRGFRARGRTNPRNALASAAKADDRKLNTRISTSPQFTALRSPDNRAQRFMLARAGTEKPAATADGDTRTALGAAGTRQGKGRYAPERAPRKR